MLFGSMLPIMRCRARGFADVRTSGLATSQYTSNFIVVPLRSIQHDQKLGGQCLRAHGASVRAAVQLDQTVAFQVTQGTGQIAGRSARPLGQFEHGARLPLLHQAQQRAVFVRQQAGQLPPRIEPDGGRGAVVASPTV